MMIKKILLLFTISSLLLTSVFAEASPQPSVSPTASWVNQRLQDALADTITKATKTAGDAKDFAIKQIPDILRQLLWWKFAESLSRIVLPLVISLIFIRLSRRQYHKTSKGDWDDCFNNGPATFRCLSTLIPAGFGVLACIDFLMSINLIWLQILVAPKVYLLEYAKSLIH